MGNWMNLMAIAGTLGLVTGFPFNPDNTKPSRTKRQDDVDSIESEFDWNNGDIANFLINYNIYEFNGIGPEEMFNECSADQQAILIKATFHADKLVNYKQKDHENTPGWNRYFNGVNPAKDGRWIDHDMKPTYESLRYNLRQLSQFPRRGKLRNGKPARSRQVSYKCKEPEHLRKCKKNPHLPAYTANPDQNPDGWAIVFCPLFFNHPKFSMSLEEREAKGPRPLEEIGELITYEHMLIHEWMHVDIFGYKEHIGDVQDKLQPASQTVTTIYGDKKCHMYAWRRDPYLEPGVSVNADNYAWFFTYDHFARQWDWDSDGRFDTKRSIEGRSDEEDEQQAASDYKGFTGPDELGAIDWGDAPDNVFMNDEQKEDDGDQSVAVGYSGQSYEDWENAIKDKKSFMSESSTCWLSWQCRKIYAHTWHPDCTCRCDGKKIDNPTHDPRCKGIEGNGDNWV